MRKIFSTKTLVIFFTVVLLAQVFQDIYLYTLPAHDTNANFWINLYGSTSIFIAILGFLTVYLGREKKTTLSRSVAWLSWGALLNGLGLFYWLYNNLHNNITVPYPSLGEYLFLSFPLLMYVGSWLLLDIYRPLIKTRLILEAAVIFLVSAALIFHYFIIPNLGGVESIFGKIVTVSIPAEDAITLAFAYIILRVSGGKMHTYLWLFVINLIILTIADFTFQYRDAVGIYWNGDIADLLYMINMYFYALAIIYMIDNSTTAQQGIANSLPPTPAAPTPAVTAPQEPAPTA
ncbi:MAG TPA: hypothetical protein VLE93_02610 [Candidatus Saccharimonadales bacterium]|nr:hypothetical protein [Candidatus Saccharimonadales bacterium]